MKAPQKFREQQIFHRKHKHAHSTCCHFVRIIQEYFVHRLQKLLYQPDSMANIPQLYGYYISLILRPIYHSYIVIISA